MSTKEAPLLAPILAIVPTVFAAVASTSNAAGHDRDCTSDSGCACNRPAAE